MANGPGECPLCYTPWIQFQAICPSLLGLIGFDFLSCFYGEKNDEMVGWFSTVIVCHSGMDLHYHPLVSAISFVFRAECNVCSTIPLSSKIVMTAFPVKKHKKNKVSLCSQREIHYIGNILRLLLYITLKTILYILLGLSYIYIMLFFIIFIYWYKYVYYLNITYIYIILCIVCIQTHIHTYFLHNIICIYIYIFMDSNTHTHKYAVYINII